MKKYTVLILVLVAAMMLCACGSDPSTSGNPGNNGSSAGSNVSTGGPVGYLFTYNGVQFGVDMKAESVLASLGAPQDQYTSKSCAFEGEDTVYYYSSIEISTNNEEGYERIYSIYLEDDLVSTEEGVSVGSTAEAVKDAYGEPGSNSSDAALIYEKDGMTLTFNLKNGVVSTILYNMI